MRIEYVYVWASKKRKKKSTLNYIVRVNDEHSAICIESSVQKS